MKQIKNIKRDKEKIKALSFSLFYSLCFIFTLFFVSNPSIGSVLGYRNIAESIAHAESVLLVESVAHAESVTLAVGQGKTVVDMWNDDRLNKTVRLPHPLVVLRKVPPLLKERELRAPPSLQGRGCGGRDKVNFSLKVEKILPAKEPLKVMKVFVVLNNPGVIKKFFYKVLSLKNWHTFRGGPLIYYQVQDSKKQEYVMSELHLYKDFYITDFPHAVKPSVVLSRFKTSLVNKTRIVKLELESVEEHIEKCNYYESVEDKKSRIQKQKQATQKMINSLLKAERSLGQGIVLQNFQQSTRQVEVNIKGLIWLMFNSSALRIKNIKINSAFEKGDSKADL